VVNLWSVHEAIPANEMPLLNTD